MFGEKKTHTCTKLSFKPHMIALFSLNASCIIIDSEMLSGGVGSTRSSIAFSSAVLSGLLDEVYFGTSSRRLFKASFFAETRTSVNQILIRWASPFDK